MLNITTLAGVQLDLFPNATIEVNMGGISLLDLSSRPATYTNSFSLPRTPTNEREFAFASQPTRNNRPSINVWISKGLFQRKAVLKVNEFDDSYKCSFSYDSELMYETLRNTPISFFDFDALPIVTFGTASAALNEICNPTLDVFPYQVFYSNTGYVNSLFNKSNNTGFLLPKYFEALGTYLGIPITGDLLTDTYFVDTLILNPSYGFRINSILFDFFPVFEFIGASKITVADTIKTICQIFMADAQISSDGIILTKLDITRVAIDIERFTNVVKKYSSGYALNNTILYNCAGTDKLFGSDTFTADGIGDKTLFTINSYVPVTDTIGYVTNTDATAEKLQIYYAGALQSETITVYNTSDVPTVVSGTQIRSLSILSMSGFYSNILNPIFAKPVILEADKYLDPLTADNIMTTRVINSVQLGGRYWVETMAYNLTTGQSKLTLIKLP